ncbi:MAG: VOC family protein [bacterium]
MKCDVYLSFDGNCEEAMDFYKDVFGGTYSTVMRYKDGPPEYCKPGLEEKIMHITMNFGEAGELKASDDFHMPILKGNNFHVSILSESEEEAHAIFNGLAEGGTISMPFNEVFWGGKFGSCMDKFGIQWMISTPH